MVSTINPIDLKAIKNFFCNSLNSEVIRRNLKIDSNLADSFTQLLSYLFYFDNKEDSQNIAIAYTNITNKTVNLAQYEKLEESKMMDLKSYLVHFIENNFKLQAWNLEKEVTTLQIAELKANSKIETWRNSNTFETPINPGYQQPNFPGSQQPGWINPQNQEASIKQAQAVRNFYPYDSKPQIIVKLKKVLSWVIIAVATSFVAAAVIQIFLNILFAQTNPTDDIFNNKDGKLSYSDLKNSLTTAGIVSIIMYLLIFALVFFSLKPKNNELDRVKYYFSKLLGFVFIIWAAYIMYVDINAIANNFRFFDRNHVVNDYLLIASTILWSLVCVLLLTAIFISIFALSKNPKPNQQAFIDLMNSQNPNNFNNPNNNNQPKDNNSDLDNKENKN